MIILSLYLIKFTIIYPNSLNKKIILQTHTDLVFKSSDIIVPGIAPMAKEKVRAVK